MTGVGRKSGVPSAGTLQFRDVEFTRANGRINGFVMRNEDDSVWGTGTRKQ